jgi:hypothetical protein
MPRWFLWRLTPRRLKLLAAGLLAGWVLLVAGLVALIVLVVVHAS